MQEGKVSDDTRLRATLPTVTELADKGAIVLLLAHFGRPKGEPRPDMSLALVTKPYEQVLGRPVRFIGEWDADAIATLAPGDVAILENTRFDAGEEKNDPAFAARLAALGDLLRQRRLLRRPPRPCLDRGHRPSAARLCRPGDGGGAEGAGARAWRSRAPGRGGGRRRQGLDQAGGAAAPGRQGRSSDHRRRHGQHLPCRARSRCRQVALRARPRRHRRGDPRRRRAGELHRPSSL